MLLQPLSLFCNAVIMSMEQTELTQNAALYKFWERSTKHYQLSGAGPADEWDELVFCLSQHGRGIGETLQYLYGLKPGFEAFMDWLRSAAQLRQTELPVESLFTKEDLDFWDENGFIIVKNAVSKEQCIAAQNAIWQYLDADILNPESWYRKHPGKNGMMLDLFQHPALDANRYSATIRKVYEELYKGTDIYLLIDKVSFNPPETDTFKFNGSRLHWDVSLQLPIPYVLQGLLYLNDVRADEGAFHCVPGFHKKIGQWITDLPVDKNPRDAAIAELKPTPVSANAGDMIIWHQALPHCATPNVGALPRMVQYITYKPVQKTEATIWI